MAKESPDSRIETGPTRDDEGKFVPGVSGNPGGRRRQNLKIEDAARAHGEGAIEILWKIASNEKNGIPSRIRACELLLNRGFGLPRQSIELGAPEGEDLCLRVLMVPAPTGEEIEQNGEPQTLEEVRAEHAARRKP